MVDQITCYLSYTKSDHQIMPFMNIGFLRKRTPWREGIPLRQKQSQELIANHANHRWQAALYAWGVGNCLPQPSTAHPWLQASPWVSKQEVTQLGLLLFLAASLPGSSSLRQGQVAVPQRVRQHSLWSSGVGDRMCNGTGQGTWGVGSTAELQHGPQPLHKAHLGLIKWESSKIGGLRQMWGAGQVPGIGFRYFILEMPLHDPGHCVCHLTRLELVSGTAGLNTSVRL